ncbi:response regulator [Cellulophaga sp. BC115SP]|uniref:response regulator n=1 Tax=Cellulophaga sp. BC115SP TaxID=2683263 RepID=UPI0014133380|nr:response regulator [Cellulophaga sp. BC115SP]NBB27172.1 response regulator [Cellulophaga sp. BC115SP]
MRIEPISLIVDDDKINRFILSKTLEDLSLSNQEVTNGLEAINWLKSTQYKHVVVFLDLNMPIIDGYEFLEILSDFKQEFSHVNIQIIVLSSVLFSDFQRRSSSTAATISSFLNKPVDIRQIKIAINKAKEKFNDDLIFRKKELLSKTHDTI